MADTTGNAPDNLPLVVVAAGGTGGHLFPAEALAVALARRGVAIDLATDERAAHYGHDFPARQTHIIPSATVRGRDPVSLARTGVRLASGTLRALRLFARLNPAVVIGFGGYPTIPPVLAATWRRTPTLIHEQNGVMGRANRLLSTRVRAIATSFPGALAREPALAAKATHTGNPVRPAVIEAAKVPYVPPGRPGPINLLAFGGSQGARIMADIVPAAVELLPLATRVNIAVTQQARPEDIARVQAIYARLGIRAEVAPFFADLPARIAASHLVVSRSGASTVAELAAIGRPAILVPLPHALDQDQLANAAVLEQAGARSGLTRRRLRPTSSPPRSPASWSSPTAWRSWRSAPAASARPTRPTGSPSWCCASRDLLLEHDLFRKPVSTFGVMLESSS